MRFSVSPTVSLGKPKHNSCGTLGAVIKRHAQHFKMAAYRPDLSCNWDLTIRMRYQRTSRQGKLPFFRSRNTIGLVRILSHVTVSNISKMAACNRKWIWNIDRLSQLLYIKVTKFHGWVRNQRWPLITGSAYEITYISACTQDCNEIPTVVSKLIYCSPAWSGFCRIEDRERINSFIKRSKRSGYCADEVKTVNELFAVADKSLLEQVLANPNHTLHQFLPPINSHDHHLRKRPHNHQLPTKRTILQQSNFIIRSLFSDTY